MAKRLDPLSIDFYELPNGDTFFFFNFLTGEDKLICLARISSLLIIII